MSYGGGGSRGGHNGRGYSPRRPPGARSKTRHDERSASQETWGRSLPGSLLTNTRENNNEFRHPNSRQYNDTGSRGHRGQRGHRGNRGRGNGGRGIGTGMDRQRSYAQQERTRQWPMSARRLQEMVDKEPTEIIMGLTTEMSGFRKLLEETTLSSELVTLLLDVIAKACGCTSSPENVASFLGTVRDSRFVSAHLQLFASCLPRGGCANNPNAIDVKPVEDLITFLRALLQHLPTSSSEVRVLVLLLENTTKPTDSKSQESPIPAETLSRINDLKETTDLLLQPFVQDNRADQIMEQSQLKKPPNNFRDIPIIPNMDELRGDRPTFLRHNLTKGKYQDVDHYLDVQFRLLREDFVAPLRDGIAEYLRNHDDEDPNRTLQDMRLYHDVHVERLTLTRIGFANLITFDTTPFKRLRWESTKRLIQGSLVCLTCDNFQNVIFGTVENRDVDQLREGRVEINFTSPFYRGRNEIYLMAETSAYYEAYRHVLKGLKEFDEYSLPLKSYIIDASVTENPPRYLLGQDVRYDLRPLLPLDTDTNGECDEDPSTRPIGNSKETEVVQSSMVELALITLENVYKADKLGLQEHLITVEESKTATPTLTRDDINKFRSVDVLNKDTWQNAAEVIGFDHTQIAAYQAALTKEFVLIQGPPGTGKTYVGLKIVRTLLYNFHPWCCTITEEPEHGRLPHWDFRPILIVCYTNHALDQFLEGIYQYEKGIVRVGGNRSSDILKPCLLSNIRQQMRKERKTAGYVHYRRREVNQEYYRLRQVLEPAQMRLELSQCGVLGITALQEYMDYNQYRSLITGVSEGNMCSDEIICKWLGIYNNGCREALTIDRRNEQKALDNDDTDGIHIQDEADILAEQRQLDDNQLQDGSRQDKETVEKIRCEFAFLPGGHLKTESQKAKHNRRTRERTVVSAISNPDIMSTEDEEASPYLWAIPSYAQRWRLYRYWLMRYAREQEEIMLRHRYDYERVAKQRKEVDDEEDFFIIRQAQVVGMTTTGAAKYRGILQQVKPKIIVVEEAAEVLEAHVITTLSVDCEHLILIGDHQQLRPNPTVYELAKQYNLDVSLFERMVKNKLPCYRLGLQHRMRPEISILMKEHFYSGLADHSSVLLHKSVPGVTSNIFFVEHEQMEGKIDDNKSKSNIHEAKFIVGLCSYILKQGYDPAQVTILTTYTGQLFHFRKLMDKATFEGVRVSVVDNYQGEENDIILLSLVRSNVAGSVGFLRVSNRVCVALSRARQGMYCIGNMKLLAQKSDLWKKITSTMQETNTIGPSMTLVCQNHPDRKTKVSCADDFKKVPDGGCMIQCDTKLDCGHVCQLYCHPYDKEHKELRCQKTCSNECSRGHKCELPCSQICRCSVSMTKTFTKCQHRNELECHEIDTATCRISCPKMLACRKHPCPGRCGEKCPDMCKSRCTKKISCGHPCTRQCGASCATQSRCNQVVEVSLPKCGHKVYVKCKDNLVNRTLASYPKCVEDCQRILMCGHRCPMKCVEKCASRCELTVKKKWPSCGHSVELPCFQAVLAECEESCDKVLPCGHRQNVKCLVDITKVGCVEKCAKLLECGHECQEKCGSQCTVNCQVGVSKEIPACGHTQKLLCVDNPMNASCKAKCSKLFPCQHNCQKPCGATCEDVCSEIIEVPRQDCKHIQKVLCGTRPADTKCDKECAEILQCNHTCAAKCSEPCSSICKRMMLKKHPNCGHDIVVECQEEPSKHTCRTPCQKMLVCGHEVQMACCDDPAEAICDEKCHRKLTCGHACTKSCSAPCETPDNLCKETTVKTNPECGHTVKVACHVNPEEDACQSPCKTTLACGHICRNLCWEPCLVTCTQKVTKTISKCGHVVTLPCHLDPDSGQYCTKPCQKALDCGHRCKEKCGAPCTNICEVTMIKILPECGHPAAKISCNVDPVTIMCTQVCGMQLDCGHYCVDRCHEGSKHPSQCRDTCNKMLMCGDRCLATCGDCLGGRFHKPCQKMVNVPVKLLCGCTFTGVCSKRLSARHVSVGNACNSISTNSCVLLDNKLDTVVNKEGDSSCEHKQNPESGRFCNEPCGKRLPCQHPCMGICGEACLSLCRTCNRREVMKIFPEFQVLDRDPIYMELKGCGHRFEVADLETKLALHFTSTNSASNVECIPIIATACPKCHRPIIDRRYERYSHDSKASIVSTVDKIKTVEKRFLIREKVEIRMTDNTLGKDRYARLTTRGRSQQLVKRVTHHDMAWALKFLYLLEVCQGKLNKIIESKEVAQCSSLISDLKFIDGSLEGMLDDHTPLTEQMAHDLQCEIARAYCLDAINKESLDKDINDMDKLRVADILASPQPFTQARQDAVANIWQGYKTTTTSKELQKVSDIIHKLQDDHDRMNFEAGKWMKCSKGHTFHGGSTTNEDQGERLTCKICNNV